MKIIILCFDDVLFYANNNFRVLKMTAWIPLTRQIDRVSLIE